MHRQDYCHPGDSDYESDADDQRPICQYGAACYRKNKSHRRDFKHPPRDRPNNKPSKGVDCFCMFCPHCNKDPKI